MKTKLNKISSLVCAFASASASFAAGTVGDIYEILPCRGEPNYETVISPEYTIDKPVAIGDTVRFKLRFVRTLAMKTDNDQWKLDYIGSGSVSVDSFVSPLKIGIYVSGRLDFATFENYVDVNANTRDFVFAYHTKPGDFALPIRLALANGPAVSGQNSGGSYLLMNDDKWNIVDKNETPANFWHIAAPAETHTPSMSPEGRDRVLDYSLVKAGFYLRDINFDSTWEKGSKNEVSAADPSAAYWRSVHSKSSVAGLIPKLVANAAISNTVTLHAWSTDESVLKIKGGREVNIVTGYNAGTPVIEKVTVGDFTFGPGYSTVPFEIEAVGAEGTGAKIVLSAWEGYSYDSTN
jgi:hypothetical protein